MKLILVFEIFVLGLGFSGVDRFKDINLKRTYTSDSIEARMLWGRWRSDDDKNSIVNFKQKFCIDIYERKIVDTLGYVLSNSCQRKDAAKAISVGNAYLLFFSQDSTLQECNEVLNLDSTTLSYRNNKTGKIHVFSKILPHGRD
jgi:hypothetical protein